MPLEKKTNKQKNIEQASRKPLPIKMIILMAIGDWSWWALTKTQQMLRTVVVQTMLKVVFKLISTHSFEMKIKAEVWDDFKRRPMSSSQLRSCSGGLLCLTAKHPPCCLLSPQWGGEKAGWERFVLRWRQGDYLPVNCRKHNWLHWGRIIYFIAN